jgi:hypothetical protein
VGALLEIVLGLDQTRDSAELKRLSIPPIDQRYIDSVLTPAFLSGGFKISERGIIPAREWPEFKTTWAKRLKGSAGREITYLVAEAV